MREEKRERERERERETLLRAQALEIYSNRGWTKEVSSNPKYIFFFSSNN